MKPFEEINEDDVLQKVGQALFMLRSEKRITLESVSDSIGVSHSVVSKIENGRYPNVSLALLIKFANHYKTSLTNIIPLENIQIFHFSQHDNSGGSFSQIANESKEGFLLSIEQYKEEVAFLRKQIEHLTINKS